MAITHDDILNKEFPTRFRGYDTDEVDAFLEDVAREVASLTRENNRLNEEIVRLQKELLDLKEEEAELRQAVLSAHRLAEEMRSQLEGQRRLMVEKARVEVDKVVAAGREELARMESRVEELRRVKRELTARLKATLEGYLRLVEEEEGQEEVPILNAQIIEEIGQEVKEELEALGLAVEGGRGQPQGPESVPGDQGSEAPPAQEPGPSPPSAPLQGEGAQEEEPVRLGPALD